MNSTTKRALFSAVFLILVMVALHWATDGTFLTSRNLTLLSRQIAINGLVAVAMTFVILIGGIDLSVGSIMALAGICVGLSQVNLGLGHWEGSSVWAGVALSVLIAVGVGIFCGAINGLLITRLQIAPFIITLGMMVIARGVALILSQGTAISPLGDAYNTLGQEFLPPTWTAGLIVLLCLAMIVSSVRAKKWLSLAGSLGLGAFLLYAFTGDKGLPVPTLICLFAGCLGIFILERTRLGRFVLALGGNEEAAWLAGIRTQGITFGVYCVMGAVAGLAGAIQAARLNSAYPTSGDLAELDAIAAVVIGGTSLLGGAGSVGGTLFGATFIGVLNNGMSLMGVGEFYQKVAKGVLIIVAVWLDSRSRESGTKAVKQSPAIQAQ